MICPACRGLGHFDTVTVCRCHAHSGCPAASSGSEPCEACDATGTLADVALAPCWCGHPARVTHDRDAHWPWRVGCSRCDSGTGHTLEEAAEAWRDLVATVLAQEEAS